MRKLTLALGGAVGTALLALGVVVSGPVESAGGATAVLKDPAGRDAGYVRIAGAGRSRVVVQAVVTSASSLPAGFHGFHIHASGSCIGPSFTSAGGHLGHAQGQLHDDHAGDMPSLLVKADHTALLMFETDRALLDRVLDDDGAAVIVHAGADNFANIPPRYGTPDATTLATGDAGSRALCRELR